MSGKASMHIASEVNRDIELLFPEAVSLEIFDYFRRHHSWLLQRAFLIVVESILDCRKDFYRLI